MFVIQAADLPISAKNYAARSAHGGPIWTTDLFAAATFATRAEAEAFGATIVDWTSWVVVSA